MAFKTINSLLSLANNEGTYGAGAVLTGSTDVIQVATDFPVFNYTYTYDGNRNGAQLAGGNLQRVAPSGRTTTGTVRIEAKGKGSAYASSSVGRVPFLHPFLLSSGMSGSLQASTWVYKPYDATVAQPASLAMTVYGRLANGAIETLPISGAYCNWKLSAEGASPAMFEFEVQGLAGTYSDSATFPARSWPTAVLPPKNDAAQVVIGSYTGVCRSWTYDHGLEIAPRVNQNTSGSHAGFAIGRRQPVLTITLEQDTLANFNPYSDFDSGTNRAVTITVGTNANNRFVLSLPQTTLSNVEQGADGPVGTWTLTYTPYVSAPDQSDDVSLTFN